MARNEILAPFFRHDNYAATDSRLRRLMREYGAKGYAVYFLTLEYLYRRQGEALEMLEVEDIALDLSLDTEEVIRILDYAVSAKCGGLLMKKVPGLAGYFSARVNQHFSDLEEEKKFQSGRMKEIRAKGGKQKTESSKARASDAIASASEC